MFGRRRLLRFRNLRGLRNSRFLHFDHASAGEFFEFAQDLIDLFRCFDKLDLERQVIRDLDDARRMHVMIAPKPAMPFTTVAPDTPL